MSCASNLRIVSLLAAATEILYLLGLGDHVVGISHECNSPPEVAAKPRVTRTRIDATASSSAIDEQVRELSSRGEPLYELDVEALIRLQPNLLVTQAACDVCAVRLADVQDAVAEHPQLSSTRVVALNPKSLTDVLDDVVVIGSAAGIDAEARAHRRSLQLRVDAVRRQTTPLASAQRPPIAIIEWIEPLMLAANWIPELVELAGGRHDLTQQGQPSRRSDFARLADYDPEIVVVAPCGFDLERTLSESAVLAGHEAWWHLSAVRRDRVYAVDGDGYISRAGPRLVDSLEILAHLIHPELIASPTQMEQPERAWCALQVVSA